MITMRVDRPGCTHSRTFETALTSLDTIGFKYELWVGAALTSQGKQAAMLRFYRNGAKYKITAFGDTLSKVFDDIGTRTLKWIEARATGTDTEEHATHD